MEGKVLVSGSICYDYILSFSDYFRSQMMKHETDKLNVAFQADKLRKSFGGTAGNICYSLRLLNIEPLIVSCVGRDFNEYLEHFKKIGINLSAIKFFDNESTASVFVVTDKAENQIATYYPGAMRYIDNFRLSEINLEGVKIGIVSPSTRQSMLNFSKEMKELGIPYIFDPGQQLPVFSREELLKITDSSRMLIMNDYEFSLFMKKTGLDTKSVAERTPLLVVTKGKDGSIIHSNNSIIEIPIAAPRQIIDPTGAGDAYRAGFIRGLISSKPIAECGLMGAIAAKYVVEKSCPQDHYYSLSEFEKELHNMKKSFTSSCQ